MLSSIPASFHSAPRHHSNQATAHEGALLRGLRVRVGIDCSSDVHMRISPTSGRMIYRGRLMNRAARLASKAPSGGVLCSEEAWEAIVHSQASDDATGTGAAVPSAALAAALGSNAAAVVGNIAGRCLGSLDLKGVGQLTVHALNCECAKC